ncbi:putative pyridoxal 5'-phosphate synthase [Microsporum audouinii]
MARPAPWRSLFEEHVQVTGSPLLSLATVSRSPDGNAVPRVRTCVLRGFFADLQLHPNAKRDMESASGSAREKDYGDTSYLNPRKYESDMLTITTDARSEKVRHILASAGGEVSGPVECLFWSPKAFAQWRIKGKAYIVGGDSSDPVELKARQEIEKSMRFRGEGSDKPWSWETEITTHFANLSPGMRGTFTQDLPGAPKSGPAPVLRDGGEGLSDLNNPVARKNFRVVVIKPEEVEYIHDEGPGNNRNERFRWELGQSDTSSTWKGEQLWP